MTKEPENKWKKAEFAHPFSSVSDGAGRRDVQRVTNVPIYRHIRSLRQKIWRHWKKSGRHELPWRNLSAGRQKQGPYKILVSEVMLQQTQVQRVIPKYQEFIRKFPSIHALAKAELTDVLRSWNGLGYNRRAKYLHDASKRLTLSLRDRRKIGDVSYDELRALPGIGDYTAKAVRVFAFNKSEILIETNIRTVFLHHFSKIWTRRVHISDEELLSIARQAARGQDPRIWHWALMDYGAHLKARGVKLNSRSTHYRKQSKFKGSLREVRGAILRALLQKTSLRKVQVAHTELYQKAFESLLRDGLVTK